MFDTLIDRHPVTGEYEGYIDGILVQTAPTEDAAREALERTVAELKALEREVYVFALGELFLDDQLSLRAAIERAERVFYGLPLATKYAVAA